MQLTDVESAAPTSTRARDRVREFVAEACEPIALSWPMKTFAYRNPLRGWEHLPFDEAIREARHLLGGTGYIPNEDYRVLYREGSISDEAIAEALQAVASTGGSKNVTIGDRDVTQQDVLRQHLLFGIDPLEPALLEWQLNGGAATEQFRHDVPAEARTSTNGNASSYLARLWVSCLSALELSQAEDENDEETRDASVDVEIELPAGRTLSDWLDSLAEASLVERINEQMIKWTAAFLDEGMADWKMPDREAGFYQAWRTVAAGDWSGRFLGIKRFAAKVRDLPDAADEALVQFLDRLGIPEHRWSEYLSRQLAQLPGWAGFIRWRGDNPGYPAQKKHPIDPLQFLAVRLFYEVELVDALCRRQWKIEGTLPAVVNYWEARPDSYRQHAGHDSSSVDARTRDIGTNAWRLFHLAQFLALTPENIASLSSIDARLLVEWLDALPSDRHGKVWLEALEATFRQQLLERLAHHRGKSPAADERPRAQFVLCIDARSESFRRHIESQGPYETFGFAGFFGIPISFQAFDTSDRAALCPVIVAPGFAVDEFSRDGQNETLEAYAAGSRWNELGQHMFHDLKSNPISSMMLIDTLGLFYSAGLTGKTFMRTPFASLVSRVRNWFSPHVATLNSIDRDDTAADSVPQGFSPEEQATFVGNGLRAFGLTRNFGRFIVICGHGSTSDNNPYYAAYNCGACGGGHGDPNARVFASMGNQPHVRQMLKENGLEIPDDTWFLAAKHNTATDQVSFYDVEDVPASHAGDLQKLAKDLEEAGRNQALERIQRIPYAPSEVSPQSAADHMVSRTVDWANVRPEWGLSSNAAFILGRRSLTQDLDLGGRVFLHSYDPDSDTEGAILEALMNAPVVVAQWISMEYYFSAVDPNVYGSGSKVTHNVVSGVGVMHGSLGDLQSGLPLQSVNDGAKHYHEPVRLLVLIEAPTSRISAVIEKHTLLQNLFQNQWIGLVAIDPATGEFHRFLSDASWEKCH